MEQGMKNIRLSYSNSPACEYIGSQVYQILGFEVQKKFYQAIKKCRYDKVFYLLLQKIIDGKKACETGNIQ